jgi:hypothetical protein
VSVKNVDNAVVVWATMASSMAGLSVTSVLRPTSTLAYKIEEGVSGAAWDKLVRLTYDGALIPFSDGQASRLQRQQEKEWLKE